MFTYLGLRNFRAFESLGLELAPITVLVGPNNSGKSSIISGLRLLAQTAMSEDFRIPLLLNGSLGDFGTHRDIVFQNKKGRVIGLTLGVTMSSRIPIKDREFQEARIDLNFAYRAQRREVIMTSSTLSDQSGRKILATAYSKESETHTVSMMLPGQEPTGEPFIERRTRLIHFLVPMWEMFPRSGKRGPSPVVNPELRRVENFCQASFESFFRGLQEVEYLGPFRAVPLRTCLFSGERPARLGMDGSKAVHILASDYLRKGRLKKKLSNQIIQWFRSADIARDLEVRVLGDRHFEMLIQHPVTQEYENLTDVGYGISQVLPVLAGGYSMVRGSTFIVEEPEIHLHPRAQSQLADFFASLYENDVQCILETHSEHLIVRLQKHVAAGRIDARKILVYYVHSQGQSKGVVKLTLGPNGFFNEKWPRGFFEDRLQEVESLARASQEAAAS